MKEPWENLNVSRGALFGPSPRFPLLALKLPCCLPSLPVAGSSSHFRLSRSRMERWAEFIQPGCGLFMFTRFRVA